MRHASEAELYNSEIINHCVTCPALDPLTLLNNHYKFNVLVVMPCLFPPCLCVCVM